jgi:hypothetical protein
MTPNTAPDAPMIGENGAKISEKHRARDAADHVQGDEPPLAEPLFDTWPEEIQRQHVEQNVRDVRVDEHIRHERPRPHEGIRRNERQRVRHAGDRLL